MRTQKPRPAPRMPKRRRPRRAIRVDGLLAATFAVAVVVLHLLLFFGGWITGQHAIEPLQTFARDVKASLTTPRVALAAEVSRARVARTAPRTFPRSEPLPELQPVRLTFAPLPPIERPRQAPPRFEHITPDFYLDLIREAAQRNDLPVALVEAVVRVESDFNARAVSSKGARGLMQVMPATGARFGVADPDHLFYPAPNISAGTAYLAWLLERYEGDIDLALAAYNAGEGAVDEYRGIPPYRETREYVRRVRKVLGRTGTA